MILLEASVINLASLLFFFIFCPFMVIDLIIQFPAFFFIYFTALYDIFFQIYCRTFVRFRWELLERMCL